MAEALALALSTIETMGLMPYITAMVVVSLVGGFISVMFNRR